MSQSRRFRILESRIVQLRHAFLPTEYSPTGSYDQLTIDRARGFRVLAHAEFESFIEDIVHAAVERAVNKWRRSGNITLPLLGIISSYEGRDRVNDFSKYPRNTPPTIETIIFKSFAHFEHNKNNNNSIQTNNILSLLSQVGILAADLDPIWLGAIDAFGAARNLVAHSTGARSYVRYTTDPGSIAQSSTIITQGLKEIDAKIRDI